MKNVFVTLNLMQKAESCFVLIVQFNVLLIECTMKIRMYKRLHGFFHWGDKGSVPAPAGFLVDLCSNQGAGPA